MKFISTNQHGTLDYLVSILLIISPWVLDYFEEGIESIIPVLLGVSTITVSLMTDYEKGVLRVIPMKTHLAIDVISALFLAASPWIFGFQDVVYKPHVTFGIVEILAVLFTKTASKNSNTNLI